MAQSSRMPHRAVTVAIGLLFVALAAFVARPVWFEARESDPNLQSTTPVSDTTPAQEADPATAFSRPLNATAAVADSRGAGVGEARALGAVDSPFGERTDTSLVEPLTQSTENSTVPAARWWRQIETLLAFGHNDKAKREFSLLLVQHPEFAPPADAPVNALQTLGLNTDTSD